MSPPRSPDRPQRILTAAAALITRLGYDKTTMDDIARQAGVSKGAIYLHWKSKEALFAALLVREMNRLLDDAVARMNADPQGGALPRMYLHATLALQANPLMRALYTQDSSILGDYVRSQGTGRYTARFLFGQSFVQKLQQAGLLRADLDPAVVAYLLASIAYGFIGIETIIPAGAAPSLEETGAALAALMQSGLAGPGGDSQAGKQAMLEIVEFIKAQYRASSPEE